MTPLTLDFNGTMVPSNGPCMATSTGDYSCSFRVPTLPAGTYDVNVTGLNLTSILASASATYTILSPALALSPALGQVSSNSTATGTDFDPNGSVALTFGGTPAPNCESGSSLTVSSAGGFSCTFAIPVEPSGVPYTVTATDMGYSASESYTVTVPTVSLAPTSGQVGSTVRAAGAGFNANHPLKITFGPDSIGSCSSGPMMSNAYGDFDCSFPVPALAAGSYPVDVTDTVNTASASFVIGSPSISLSVTQGTVGTVSTASGSGFAPSSPLTLKFNSTPVSVCTAGQLTTDSSGAFSCAFAVPASTSGSQKVSVNDTLNGATTTFTVVAGLALSPDNGSFNESITAIGTGFEASASVAVAWNSTYPTLCTGVAGSDGSFSCSYRVPNAPAGPDVLTATAAHGAPTASFQVDPAVLLNSSTVLVGQPLHADAFGFDPSATITILWDHATAECGGATTDTNGAASCAFIVPATAGGENTVSFVQGGLEANQTIVVNSSFTIYPPSGVLGTSVELIGFGFDAATIYVACFETTPTSCPSGTAFTTATNGSIPANTNFIIPNDPPGNYYLVDSLGSTRVGVANFTITTSAVLLAPHSGPVGTTVGASGVGFNADASFTLAWNSTTTLCAGMTNSTGGFSCTFVVPNAPGGSHTLVLTEGSFAPTAAFDILPSLAVSPTTAKTGTTVTVSGWGLAADNAYTVSWPPTGPLCTGITNGNGAFVCSFVVRSVTPGVYSITASQGNSLPSASIFVLGPSNGPAPPPLLAWALTGIAVLVVAAVGLWVYVRSRRGATSPHPPARAGNTPSPPPPKPTRPTTAPVTAPVTRPPPEGALYERLAPIYREVLKPKPPTKTRESSAKTNAPVSPKQKES
jgi:hypothetical protein